MDDANRWETCEHAWHVISVNNPGTILGAEQSKAEALIVCLKCDTIDARTLYWRNT